MRLTHLLRERGLLDIVHGDSWRALALVYDPADALAVQRDRVQYVATLTLMLDLVAGKLFFQPLLKISLELKALRQGRGSLLDLLYSGLSVGQLLFQPGCEPFLALLLCQRSAPHACRLRILDLLSLTLSTVSLARTRLATPRWPDRGSSRARLVALFLAPSAAFPAPFGYAIRLHTSIWAEGCDRADVYRHSWRSLNDYRLLVTVEYLLPLALVFRLSDEALVAGALELRKLFGETRASRRLCWRVGRRRGGSRG